ncbi:MAG TPA: DNA polymerase III subunit alpha, partial [Candidatus Sphingobacterium stercoripullorum]|nr:DNA polymerase III subunit alpha [Candidatus Sphingobacterium stercoripullorum]
PPLSTTIIEDLYDEVELIGFPVSSSLFTLAKSDYRGDVSAENLASYNGRIVRVVGHLVTWKTVYTKHKAIMKFGTFLDVNGKFIDTVHFPQSLARHPLKGKGLYLIEGKCVVDYGYPTIEVHRCALMPLKSDPRHV